jgi:hypothetical protein
MSSLFEFELTLILIAARAIAGLLDLQILCIKDFGH